MANEKTLNIHTHKIMEGAECQDDRPCAPMGLALKKGWILMSSKTPMGPEGKPHQFICVGDMDLGYLSVFRFCPWCGTNYEEKLEAYAKYQEKTSLTRYDTRTGETQTTVFDNVEDAQRAAGEGNRQQAPVEGQPP